MFLFCIYNFLGCRCPFFVCRLVFLCFLLCFTILDACLYIRISSLCTTRIQRPVIKLCHLYDLNFLIGAQQPIGQRQPIYGSTHPMSPSVHNQNAVTHMTQHLTDASQLARRCQLGSGTHLRTSCCRFQWAI